MHHALGDWILNALALVDQLNKIIEDHLAKPTSRK
jgi:hypothetical protein